MCDKAVEHRLNNMRADLETAERLAKGRITIIPLRYGWQVALKTAEGGAAGYAMHPKAHGPNFTHMHKGGGVQLDGPAPRHVRRRVSRLARRFSGFRDCR